MKAKINERIKPSEPEKVNEYMKNCKHPLVKVVEALRKIILSADKEIGEEVKWNAPTFFYAGDMAPSDSKKYKRYLIVFNLFQKDCIRLVFPSGVKVDDGSGFLIGDYADGRRLALFHDMKEVKANEKKLQTVVKRWLKQLDK
ncbi:MAG: DUF1801 domain-containing protein [Bacteroidetes bacterium]|nr:DUF1801 domain-containing protein [Bacteroidota bacterium]